MCEKLQAATVNPGSVNPLCTADVVDFAHSNPSLSSDDTLAASTVSPILDDNVTASNSSSRDEVTESALLVGGYDTSDGESEDGFDFHNTFG